MSDDEAFEFILKAGIPICQALSDVLRAPKDMVPKLLGAYISEFAEQIEPGGRNNIKLVKYLTGSVGAVVGLLLAKRVCPPEEEPFGE